MIDSKKLKAAIRDSQFTQKQVAAKVGIEETYLSRICNNDQTVRDDTLQKLCEALSVSPYELWKLI